MPYIMRPLAHNKYKVLNSNTGEIKAKSTTKTKAQNQIKLLNMIHNKMK